MISWFRTLGRQSYSTAYPSARALSRTRKSRVTMVTSCGGSSSSSAVARCTASSVRMGSSGNGRPTRASTTLSTSRMKQRRSKVRKPRTAAFSSAAVNRPEARDRTIARAASARVRADVTYSVPAGSGFRTAVSCSSSAASSALDSMYRMLAVPALADRAREVALRGGRRCRSLRFATVAVDQFGGCAPRQSDVRPILERVASLDRRVENARRNEFVPPACARSPRVSPRRNQFSDNAPVGRHRNPLAGLDSADVAAQVVLQLSDSRFHESNIATYGHIRKFKGPSHS